MIRLVFPINWMNIFQVFHMPWLSIASLWLAIIICAFEIGLGVALLLGSKMKFTAWSLLLMIVFLHFSFLFWYFDVVKIVAVW